MSNNPNHPQKGSSIKVEPIRQKAAIERIKAMMLHKKQWRNQCLFTLGINTALRANELLSISVENAANLLDSGVGARLDLKQSKNQKYRPVTINKTAYDALQLYFEQESYLTWKLSNMPDSPLFFSRVADVLTVPSVTALVKGWCAGAGCKGNYGSHTMRKTWGWHQYKANTPLPVLMLTLGHATQRQTLDYLCIQDSQIKEVYSMEL